MVVGESTVRYGFLVNPRILLDIVNGINSSDMSNVELYQYQFRGYPRDSHRVEICDRQFPRFIKAPSFDSNDALLVFVFISSGAENGCLFPVIPVPNDYGCFHFVFTQIESALTAYRIMATETVGIHNVEVEFSRVGDRGECVRLSGDCLPRGCRMGRGLACRATCSDDYHTTDGEGEELMPVR